MEGGNMVGIGQTGSGKTLAFLLPAFSHIQKMRRERKRTYRDEGPVALVLTPTRHGCLKFKAFSYLRYCAHANDSNGYLSRFFGIKIRVVHRKNSHKDRSRKEDMEAGEYILTFPPPPKGGGKEIKKSETGKRNQRKREGKRK